MGQKKRALRALLIKLLRGMNIKAGLYIVSEKNCEISILCKAEIVSKSLIPGVWIYLVIIYKHIQLLSKD